ncbi:type II secretion system protein GspN [Pigmentibacter ruber]|nr:hypothetical protein GTC16762_27050 [Pigmentibacter ruber]
MNKKKIISYIFISLFAFIVILYHTFPYSLLKENIVIQVQNQLNTQKIPLTFSMISLKPYWVTGVEIRGLELENKLDHNDELVIRNITARLSLLPLLIGNITLNMNIEQRDGTIIAKVVLPLFSTLSGEASLKYLDMQAKNFKLDSIFSQLLNVIRLNEKPELALITPIIAKTKIGGRLFGTITYEEKGRAVVKLSLKESYLNTANEALNIPLQNFTTANVDFDWNGKKIQISPTTKFESEDIKFDLNGFVETPSDPKLPWHLDLGLNLKMSGQVEKDFGFLIPQLLNCPNNVIIAGLMKLRLVGDSSSLSCQ